MTDKTLIEDLQTLQNMRVDSYGIGTLQAAQKAVEENKQFRAALEDIAEGEFFGFAIARAALLGEYDTSPQRTNETEK